MANNRTLVPGMDSENSIDSLYSRGAASEPYSGTLVPGMQVNAPGVLSPGLSKGSSAKKLTSPAEPVLGFLYSISRYGVGEYWPLHLGANTIGRSSENDIVLKEKTVSGKHAELYVRKMKSTGAVIASVRDTGSKMGMFLNDEELDFENHTVKDGDILTVGANYRLLVILINANALGLSVAQDFQPEEEEEKKKGYDAADPFDETQSYQRKEQTYQDDGTIDLSGGSNPFASGGTSFMG